MKMKKKTALLVSFAVGTLLFATTALAEIANKSGYDQLKDALKVTAENCSENFASYTMDLTFALKDNGETLMMENPVGKFDRSTGAKESITIFEGSKAGKTVSYFYSDKNTWIQQNTGEDTYYVTEFDKARETNTFSNPFKENGAEDIERIADALVGSLKDYVAVTDLPNGGKEFSGTLTEVQIPPLVNAIASFQIKQQSNGNYYGIPLLTKDVYVKEVKGTATVNADGILESMLGTAILVGTDDQGQVHEITMEVLGKLKDINSTIVTKPDLTGKKVVQNIDKSSATFYDSFSNPQKYIGVYRNNIVTEKDGKYVKLGERILEITQIDAQTVVGKYHEEYKEGFADYASPDRNFSFTALVNQGENTDPQGAQFNSESGQPFSGNLHFDPNTGKIYFDFNRASMNYDSEFIPVLE